MSEFKLEESSESGCADSGCAGTVGGCLGAIGGWYVFVALVHLFWGGFVDGDIPVNGFLFALVGALLGALLMIRTGALGPRKKLND